ncbi:MAG TPA: YqgE/AlgH family protein [Rhodanobacteraceae bacterium]|jgi:putative transcriptional regulator|nr:YqgE/AlgH family protein [Rhodanobacteraceae bacterium]
MVKSSDKDPNARKKSDATGKRPPAPPTGAAAPSGDRLGAANAQVLTGHFLIAMPGMGDPNFARGITFVCQHSEDGAMGLVVNRLSDYRLGDVLQQMHMPCERAEVADAPVLVGGPVQPERGFVLHASGKREWDSSYRVNDALTVTTSRDILAAMADGDGPDRALVALGYAGWGAGQLEQELRENAWLTVGADERILFDIALDERWGAAVALVGINPANLTSYSGRA